MIPSRTSITLKSGADFLRTLRIKDENGNPKDLSGFTARAQIRETTNGPVAVDLTTENGGIVISATEGMLQMVMTGAQTANLLPYGVFDLFLFKGATTTCLIEGEVQVLPRVTK